MTINAYRITKKAYASSIWSGIGAKITGGRWNSRGIAVIYAAESRALAAMEQLVHLIKPRLLSGYVIASITFDASLVQRISVASLPRGWSNPVAPSSLKRIGDRWIAAGKFPVLAVPSAVIRGEWNYLINPAHPKFHKLQKTRPVPFKYDQRLG